MPRRSFAAYAALSALALTLAGGAAAAPAFAAPGAPVPGSAECTSAVNGSGPVTAASSALTQAQTTVNTDRGALRTAEAALANQKSVVLQLQAALDAGTVIPDNAPIGGVTGTVVPAEVTQASAAVPGRQQAVADARATLRTDQGKATAAREALKTAIGDQTKALCTGTADTSAPAPTPSPATAPVFADEKDCIDFASQDAAQAFFLAHRTATQPDPDRLDANNNGIACEGASGDAATKVGTSTTTKVTPTQSDGSTAITSGSQVTDVPEGSAQTGAA